MVRGERGSDEDGAAALARGSRRAVAENEAAPGKVERARRKRAAPKLDVCCNAAREMQREPKCTDVGCRTSAEPAAHPPSSTSEPSAWTSAVTLPDRIANDDADGRKRIKPPRSFASAPVDVKAEKSVSPKARASSSRRLFSAATSEEHAPARRRSARREGRTRGFRWFRGRRPPRASVRTALGRSGPRFRPHSPRLR